MFLKSLTLKGFKSFADRTAMTFDPGLTVVVGPNGSGKSNVSDAILWVLGEQSAKALRGQAMEDVIFAGSSARQPVGVAEVTLVLDNTDHTLPIEFSEVAITRRMFRSGTAEYLINGAPARLRDVRDILHDSGLGRETHSIISQGKLDSVLSSKPEDRRELIEEAAGTAKHRRRKERSEAKLQSMDKSLTRAKDISREIHRNLRPLERQANKARRHEELAASLAELTTRIAVDELRDLQVRYGELSTREREAQAAIELAEWRVRERQAEYEKLQSMLEERGLFVGDLAEQRRRLQEQLGRINSDMLLLEEKGKNMVARISDKRRELSNLRRQQTDSASQLENVGVRLADDRAREKALTDRIGDLEPKAKEAKGARRDLSSRHGKLMQEQRAAQRTADSETVTVAKLKSQISSSEIEDQMFASRLDQVEEAIGAASAALASRGERKAEVEQAMVRAKSDFEEATGSVAGLEAALVRARAKHDDARKDLSSAEASLAGLRELDARMEGSSPLVASLVADAQVAERVRCRLADVLGAPQEAERAIESLLGEDLAALVVDGEKDMAEVASRAAAIAGASGKATIVCVGDSVADHDTDVPGKPLIDLLDVPKGYDALAAALLGDVRLVDDIDAAIEAHGENPDLVYVTPAGETLLPDGRLSVGGAAGAAEGSLARKRSIRTLEGKVPALAEALAASESELATAEAALVDARTRLAEAQGEVARLGGELQSLTSEMGRLSSQRDSAVSQRDEIQRQRTEAAERAQGAKDSLASHEAAAEKAQELARTLADELADVDRQRSEASRLENKIDADLSSARLELATVSERRRYNEDRERELSKGIDSLAERVRATQLAANALDVMRLRVNPLHERYAAIEACAQERAKALQDEARFAETGSETLRSTIGEAKEALEKARGELDAARREEGDVKVEAGRLEVQVENVIKSIAEAGTMPLEDALELPPLEDRVAAQKTSAGLRRQIEKLGPVNAVAMEEFEALQERASYIDGQIADLEKARTSLLRISQAIERRMRQQFLSVFAKVNDNFREIFSMLFPGGEAHLEMTDPDHPDQTGIEVVAQPKGKRLTKMMLMSGGEKALTALALLFAVYRTRTVPFYVFDEVEAALDDANLSKFLDAIESLKQSTQLIVISHQRRTMEEADVLYGVSMQADGVSRVVSQRLDRRTGKVVESK